MSDKPVSRTSEGLPRGTKGEGVMIAKAFSKIIRMRLHQLILAEFNIGNLENLYFGMPEQVDWPDQFRISKQCYAVRIISWQQRDPDRR